MKNAKSRHPTSMDVAQRAGVSHMTVSRVFRNPEKVTKITRDHVLSIARELGYVPSQISTGLKTNRTDLVAIAVPSLENSLFSATIDGLATAVKPLGCDVVVAAYDNDPVLEAQVVFKLLSRRPLGLVLQGTDHTADCRLMLAKSKVPVIEIGDLVENPVQSVISFSNFQAAHKMTSHLISRGYKRIGMVGLEAVQNSRSRERRDGFMRALGDAGQEIDPSLMITTAPGFEAGSNALLQLLAKPVPPDAIFFTGDVHAIGALMECNKRKISVPDRVAIAGFDDHAFARFCLPPLTSLTIPRREIGLHAGHLIADLSREGALKTVVTDLGFKLNARGSA